MIDALNPSPVVPTNIVKEDSPHHPLAIDTVGDGAWQNLDRWSERAAGWLNPILVKEARQALKSRQFVGTFFLLLLTAWLWSIAGVVTQTPDIYYVPTGISMLSGYYFILAIPLIGIVPLAAHRSLAAEIDDGTFEMLVITKLSASGIVFGKLNSAILQMLVYFAAIVPCLAFSYLLRGVNLQTILMLLGVVFFAAMLLTTAGLLLATLATNRAGQLLSLLGVLGLVIFAEFLCGAFCMEVVLAGDILSNIEGIVFSMCFLVIGVSLMALFLKAAMARIAPVTQNRSSGLRWLMFVQQLVWISVMGLTGFWYDASEPMSMGILVLGIYWLVMGTLMLSESRELSPRVQRQLPQTFLGRMMLTWFNPGPGTGFIFAIATGSVGMTVLGISGMLLTSSNFNTSSAIIAMIYIGYLMMYLSVGRLIVMPLSRRMGNSFTLSVAVMMVVLMVALLTPSVVWVLVTGSVAMIYDGTQLTNWSWTTLQAFDQGFSPEIAVMIFLIGLGCLIPNLFLLFREFRYRRVAVPQRVQQDASELRIAQGS